jgi:hypothetical protein
MNATDAVTPPAPKWAIVELLGHLRLAGLLSEEEHFGSRMGRLDIPQPDGSFVTRLFGGGSVYSISFVEESVARAVTRHAPAPVSSWELPKPATVKAIAAADLDTEGDEPDDYDLGDSGP